MKGIVFWIAATLALAEPRKRCEAGGSAEGFDL